MGSLDSNGVVVLTGEDAHSTLLKVRLLRQRGEMTKARLLLEKSLLQWPQDQEIKDLLLQTEKDQLALKRQMVRQNDGAGLVDDPRGLVLLGLIGSAGTAFCLYLIARTVLYLSRHGINAQMEVRSRVHLPDSVGSYQIPVYSELTTWFVFLCVFTGLIWYAVRSYRS